MKKFIFGILLAAGLSGLLSSCSGFLDQTPTNAVAASDALTNISDAGTAVNGFYTPLKYYTMYSTNNIVFGDIRADILYSAKEKKAYDTVYRLQYNAVQNSYFSSLWGGYYSVINRVNTFLENIGPLYETIETKYKEQLESYIAEAYAVRGFCYFELARLYGYPYTSANGPQSLGAVLVTETISASEAKEMKRSTVEETYKRAIEDLEEKALPDIASDMNDGHFNSWAVKALLSRIYLYKGEWQKAYDYAVQVINNDEGYALVDCDGYKDYWGHDNQPESVLEFLISLKGDIDDDGGFGTIYHNLWFGLDDNAGYSVVPTKKWRDAFAGHEDDIRYQMLEEYAPSGITTDLWLKKFIGNQDKNFTFRRNSPRIIRMSEVYLNAAEAASRLGNTAKSTEYLDAVRQRREPGVAAINAPTVDDILNERFKEFIGEGHRFYDMMRCGKAIVHDGTYDSQDYIADGGVVTIDVTDYRVVLPIDDSELGIYPELQQNPGY